MWNVNQETISFQITIKRPRGREKSVKDAMNHLDTQSQMVPKPALFDLSEQIELSAQKQLGA